MGLTSPLVHEKVWLDKPKYDTAERLYYERLAKSSVSDKGEVCRNSSNNLSNSEPDRQIASDSNLEIIDQEPFVCTLKPKDIKSNICSKPAGDICQRPNEGKKQNKGQVKDEAKAGKDKETHKICSLPGKQDKIKKECSQKGEVKVEPEPKVIPETVCMKTSKISTLKTNVKNVQEKPSQFIDNLSSPATNYIETKPENTKIDDIAVTSNNVSIEITTRLISLEKINQDLTSRMETMEQRIISLEKALQTATAAVTAATCSRPVETKAAAPKPVPPPKQQNDDDDDGVDLFGSDSEEEDAEAAKIKEQRLAEYAAKKSKKPALIAKSSIILDVKPWDDETDMKKMEEEVRKIRTDGLLWGASKLAPLAYGIHKLQINCVIEDDKVSVDWLQETIQEIEDYVQSVDIAAFNKI